MAFIFDRLRLAHIVCFIGFALGPVVFVVVLGRGIVLFLGCQFVALRQ